MWHRIDTTKTRRAPRPIEYTLRFKFKASNNEAEYEALITGFKLGKEDGAKKLKVFSDSQSDLRKMALIVKGAKMILYHQKVRSVIEESDKVEVIKIPRSKNTLAESLSNLTISKINEKERTILVEELKERSIAKAKEVQQVSKQGPSWMDSIKSWLQNGTLPLDKKEAQVIMRKAPRYIIINEKLYKRSFSTPF